MSPFILFFGNPLVDISVRINDFSILHKYGLDKDDQKELGMDIIRGILKDIYAANLSLQKIPNVPNGVCVCLVHGTHRSLVANVGASTHFSLEFVKTSKELQKYIEEASLVHVEGFFLSDRFEVCRHIVGNLHKERHKMLSYNLNAGYVCRDLCEESTFMAVNADILIGNLTEFRALGLVKYNVQDIEDVIFRLYEAWKSESQSCDSIGSEDHDISKSDPRRFGKIFAVTNNCHPVLVVWGAKELCRELVPVPKLSPSEICDTTGAGDTFMAGFFHALLEGLHPVPAARYAVHMATQKIQYKASVMPPKPPQELSSFIDARFV